MSSPTAPPMPGMSGGARAKLLLAALWLLAGAAATTVDPSCPNPCQCLAEVVDCSRVCPPPVSLPEWTSELHIAGCAPPADWWSSVAALRRLRKLVATKADLTEMPAPDALRRFVRLEHLDLSGNELHSFGADSLPDLPSLRSLKLSNNRVENLESGAFDSLANLSDLHLNRNKLTKLPKYLFNATRPLVLLDLSHNSIREIDDFTFRNLPKLKKLLLRRNDISVLKHGAFYGLGQVKSLELDRNAVRAVSKGWIFGLDSLESLSLSRNKLDSLESGCWEWSGKLKTLDLSDNSLAALTSRDLENLQGLRTLRLDGNQISSIAEGAFAHAPNLENLRLDGNRILRTVEDATAPFAGLAHLKVLSLARNRFKSVGERALRGLESLVELDLRGNAVASINSRAFDSLSSLRELRLDGAALLCDCDLRWLSAWAARLSRPELLTATCAYPPLLIGKPVRTLKQDDFACDDSPKPRIFVHPESRKAPRGGSVRLACEAASGAPDPVAFTWRKNDAEVTEIHIENKVLYENGTTRASSQLTVSDASDEDIGKYQCLASNGYGTAYSQVAKLTIVVYPRFVKRPANLTVRVGETAKLECSATGEPTPQIAWQKDDGDDFPAARERRMHMIEGDDAFFIVNSKPADAGVYSCTAKNDAGSAVAGATLNVLEAPSFVNAMENKEIAAGESVVIECLASGSPKPQLRWLKDGAPIAATERHFFTAENQLLIVVNTVPGDEGLYECEIENSLGVARGSTELRVTSPTNVFQDEDTTGIVIIAVVCCAVGTSIVWVVIIYQTRKRLKRAVARYTADAPSIPPPTTLSLTRDPESPRAFFDDVSEHSSCKDSGTGDSAKRGSVEIVPAEEGRDVAVTVYVNPREEGRSLLEGDGVPNEGGYLFTIVSSQPAVYNPGYPAMGQPAISPEVQQWFANVDRDRSGHINADELKLALVNAQGKNFSDTACRLMIGIFDHDKTGTINLEEFDKLYSFINQWLGVFHTYDRDQSGHIDENELHQALTQMGFRFSPEFIKMLVMNTDIDKGQVSVDRFIVTCVQIQRFTEAFRSRDTEQQGVITIGFEEFLKIALSCSI